VGPGDLGLGVADEVGWTPWCERATEPALPADDRAVQDLLRDRERIARRRGILLQVGDEHAQLARRRRRLAHAQRDDERRQRRGGNDAGGEARARRQLEMAVADSWSGRRGDLRLDDAAE